MVGNNVLLQNERPPRLQGCALPGMSRVTPPDPTLTNSWSQAIWYPRERNQFTIDPQSQPIFKLHGSSNWQHLDGRHMLIIGGAKMREIGQTPILNWYYDQFEEMLYRPDTKLMVVGYGFRDDHVNQTLIRAGDRGMKMFVIAPEGADLARQNNPTRARNQIVVPTPLEAMFEQTLIGASRRSLSGIFGQDTAEFNKIMQFFA